MAESGKGTEAAGSHPQAGNERAISVSLALFIIQPNSFPTPLPALMSSLLASLSKQMHWKQKALPSLSIFSYLLWFTPIQLLHFTKQKKTLFRLTLWSKTRTMTFKTVCNHRRLTFRSCIGTCEIRAQLCQVTQCTTQANPSLPVLWLPK